MIDLKVKVKIPFQAIKGEILNDLLVYKINAIVQREIKGNILAGRSPVLGEGRYEAYKAQRASAGIRKAARTQGVDKDIRRGLHKVARDLEKQYYPFTVMHKYADKQVRPVNLFLSGKMLSFYRAFVKDGQINIGIDDKAPDKVKTIAKAHQGGHTRGWFPARPLVPQKGQTYSIGVIQAFRDLFKERILAILARQKKS